MIHDMRRPAGGQIVPLMAVVLLLSALVGIGLVQVAAASARRGAAQAAADAAALAGAADGRSAAEAMAVANGAELVAYEIRQDDVLVTVTRAGHRAVARARWVVAMPRQEARHPDGGGGTPDRGRRWSDGVHPIHFRP